MHKCYDIADWFLSKTEMTHKKLQKLCYYAQAWSYAICPEPISDAVFEAWVHGPVCRELYEKYREYGFSYIPQPATVPSFTPDENAFLDDVWETYGDISANALEALSHSEAPWQKARAGYQSNEPCNVPIKPTDMSLYYRSIYTGGDA